MCPVVSYRNDSQLVLDPASDIRVHRRWRQRHALTDPGPVQHRWAGRHRHDRQRPTGTANGRAVTATYTDPAAAVLAAGTKALGGANVEVSAANVVPDALGGVLSSNVATVTDQPLTTPVTVASTTTNSGSGVTAMTGSYKIRIPQTAVTSAVYGGTVTYTVASVR